LKSRETIIQKLLQSNDAGANAIAF